MNFSMGTPEYTSVVGDGYNGDSRVEDNESGNELKLRRCYRSNDDVLVGYVQE